jgi:hypothetical protein
VKFAEGIAKSWIQWWDNEVWKKDPLKPYDPRLDGGDDAVGGMSPAMTEAPMEAPMADDGDK